MMINKLICLGVSAGGVISGVVAGLYVGFHQGSAADIVITTISGGVCGVIVSVVGVLLGRTAYFTRVQIAQEREISAHTISESDLSSRVPLQLEYPNLSRDRSLEAPFPIASLLFIEKEKLLTSPAEDVLFEVNLESPKIRSIR